jgi:hypothetical protein
MVIGWFLRCVKVSGRFSAVCIAGNQDTAPRERPMLKWSSQSLFPSRRNCRLYARECRKAANQRCADRGTKARPEVRGRSATRRGRRRWTRDCGRIGGRRGCIAGHGRAHGIGQEFGSDDRRRSWIGASDGGLRSRWSRMGPRGRDKPGRAVRLPWPLLGLTSVSPKRVLPKSCTSSCTSGRITNQISRPLTHSSLRHHPPHHEPVKQRRTSRNQPA